MTAKKKLFINSLPKQNTRTKEEEIKRKGLHFHTVVVGVPRAELKALTGLEDSDLDRLTVTMEIFPEKVATYTKAKKACQKNNWKLILSCDEYVLTEVKPNSYIDKAGMTVNRLQASVWGVGETQLDILQGSFSISAELAEAMGQLDDDEDDTL